MDAPLAGVRPLNVVPITEKRSMFESAEIGHRVSKAEFREAVPELRTALLQAQAELFEKKPFPVLLIISGQDGAGKGETINTLYEWMDPRFVSTLAFAQPTQEERLHPPMWRYWRSLPPKGRVGIFAGSWYSEPIRQHIAGEITQAQLEARATQINRFEGMLAQEGTLILKFWFHLSKDAQRERLKELEKDPRTAWRVTSWNWDRVKTYDQLQQTAEPLLRTTSTPWAPWTILEATDDRYRSLAVGQMLLKALRERLDQAVVPPIPRAAPAPRVDADGRNILSSLDLSQQLPQKSYKTELAHWQSRLAGLVRDPRFQNRALVCAFEGADAAGKGGAIRRICAALDARQYQVIPIAAPSEEERQQPYLWRFWRHLPRRGTVSIFDRTWYGRVLVERIEGFCEPKDWQRAYAEINDFEHGMTDVGIVVVKFWVQISQEEQLRRFKERESIPFKRYKLTDEDWRNRDKWDSYQHAVCDMVERTSTGNAPWTLIEGNDKKHARVKILRTVCEQLERALNEAQPPALQAPNAPSASVLKAQKSDKSKKARNEKG
jgi:polyphosphate:AMP phosphotransferase